MNISRGRSFKFKTFWNEISMQRKKRNAARMEAERTEGKSPEDQRLVVIEWRRESALMKRKVMETKRKSWNTLLNKMDCITDSDKAYRLLNKLNNVKKDNPAHQMKIGNVMMTNDRNIAEKFNKHFLNKYKYLSERRRSKNNKVMNNAGTTAQKRN
ncbi:hypothetical protein NPIL_109151 [Nephila pilipes]|uniref:Uncharacterized protein n=1 Tax=Nephila pilipes TaxID=299642 RepID=A0A8X6MQ38_NEPPI|nr:hypothetical protein NPIL_109151 [Nephila pilipes]